MDPSTQDIVIRYFEALNTHDPDQVLALYHSQGVHVNSERTIQGIDALRSWYNALFNQVLPNATFTLTDYLGDLGSRHFTWTAVSDAGNVNNGQDSFGLVGGKIVYHFTFFTIG